MIKRMKLILRKYVRENPDILFVFGDNMCRRGRGGQAREMRGEPNVVGIPTKWAPSKKEKDYFTDLDLIQIQSSIDEAFAHLAEHLQSGGAIVWPTDGVGTGLAQLPWRAPAIHAYISTKLADLEEK